MARKTTTSFSVEPITVERMNLSENKILEEFNTGLYKLAVNSSLNTIKYSIIKKIEEQFKPIAITDLWEMKTFEMAGTTIEEVRKLAISGIFKKIPCKICKEDCSAIHTTETEIGQVCYWCWNSFKPKLEWKVIDNLESYIKKEWKTR